MRHLFTTGQSHNVIKLAMHFCRRLPLPLDAYTFQQHFLMGDNRATSRLINDTRLINPNLNRRYAFVAIREPFTLDRYIRRVSTPTWIVLIPLGERAHVRCTAHAMLCAAQTLISLPVFMREPIGIFYFNKLQK
jgi:hypothetical protein